MTDKEHPSQGVEVRRYNLDRRNLEDYFTGFTLDQLARYDVSVHGERIDGMCGGYLLHLAIALRFQEYALAGPKISSQIRYCQDEWVGFTGVYDRSGMNIEFVPMRIPKEILDDLDYENKTVFSVIDNFKKLNWALKRRLGIDEGVPDLGKDTDYYVQRMHESLIDISDFHHSERNRAFIMDSPDGPSISASNQQRNNLYDFVDTILERREHPLIDWHIRRHLRL